MRYFYPSGYENMINSAGSRLRFVFVSERLLKLILKKVLDGNWDCHYIETVRTGFFPGYRVRAASDKGLFLMVRE